MVPFALDSKLVPGVCGYDRRRGDHAEPLSVGDLVEPQIAPQGTDPQDGVVARVLISKNDSRHLLRFAANGFHSRGELEVRERLRSKDKQRKALIGFISRELRQDGAFGAHSRLG